MLTQEVEDIRDEISMHKVCVHPGVIRLLDYFESLDNFHFCLERRHKPADLIKEVDDSSPQSPQAGRSNLGTCLASVTLHDFMLERRSRAPTTEYDLLKERNRAHEIAKEIATALEHLHGLGIVLRDLDTHNIIMTNESEHGLPRISNLKNA